VDVLCELCVILAFFAVKGLILLQFEQKALNRKVRKEGPRRAQKTAKLKTASGNFIRSEDPDLTYIYGQTGLRL
jgi:hypothetical protein